MMIACLDADPVSSASTHPPYQNKLETVRTDFLEEAVLCQTVRAHTLAAHLVMMPQHLIYHYTTLQLTGALMRTSRCPQAGPPHLPSAGCCPEALRIHLSAGQRAQMPWYARMGCIQVVHPPRRLLIPPSNSSLRHMHPDHRLISVCWPSASLIIGPRANIWTRAVSAEALLCQTLYAQINHFRPSNRHEASSYLYTTVPTPSLILTTYTLTFVGPTVTFKLMLQAANPAAG